MKLYIKNMVCDRCVMVVRQQLEALQLDVKEVKLGEADIKSSLDDKILNEIKDNFSKIGFELIENKKQVLSEKIKSLIIERLNSPEGEVINLSEYLSEKMEFDYHYLSHVFSEIENITIEKFVINKKVEKVKALLGYGELSISEIAWKMGYSSVQALSAQFKKATGLTPSEYKKNILLK